MNKVWWAKFALVLALVGLAAYMLYPSYYYFFKASEAEKASPKDFCAAIPSWMSCKKVNLGLDLQGGVHLVMGVVVEKAVQDRVDRIADNLKEVLNEEKIPFTAITVPEAKNALTADGEVSLDLKASTEIEVKAPVDSAKAIKKAVQKSYGNSLDVVGTRDGGAVTVFGLSENEIDYVKTEAVEQAIKAIRNRSDKLGVAEPSIARRGVDNILIQLPGIKDPEHAIDIIGRTAQLEFKIVDDEASSFMENIVIPEGSSVKREVSAHNGPKGQVKEVYLVAPTKRAILELVNGKVPADREIAFSEELDPKTKEVVAYRTYLLHRKAGITGDYLTNAMVQQDNETQSYYVAMSFDAQGAKIFEDLTGEHTRERMAVVLDGQVNSAPVIEGRIAGGNARITLGGFMSSSENLREAKDLVLVLKAGALPAPIVMREQRQVGESLGRDSIEAGSMALAIGFALVFLFMILYYKGSGLVADIALLLNLVFLLAVMAMFEATLTLPGMAGIVLTVGMAVDANVIIFERIREELRSGKTPRAAVEAGYSKAFWAIFDSNVTTIIAGIVLMQYGSGPVRGFAVTLITGIICSMFTALFVTRMIFDGRMSHRSVRKLSI